MFYSRSNPNLAFGITTPTELLNSYPEGGAPQGSILEISDDSEKSSLSLRGVRSGKKMV